MRRGEGRGTRGEKGRGACAVRTALRWHVGSATHLFGIVFFAAILAAAIARGTESTAAPLASIDRIQIGFAGHYKVGFYTPVEITLTGGSKSLTADLEIIVPDGDGVPTRSVEHGVHLEPGKTARRARSYVKIGRQTPTITVTIITPDVSVPPVERAFSGDDVPPALAATQRLILELGGPLEFGSVVRFNEEGQPEQTTVVAIDDPASLPDRWIGYDGVDFIVLTSGQPAFYQKVPAESLAAMRRWVQFGGRLLLSVGAHGDELLSSGAPLAQFAPGKFVKTISLERFGAIENFAGASQRIVDAAAKGRQSSIPAAKLSGVRGRIEAFEGNGADKLPLVVRTADGFGEVVFVGVDLNSPPIDHWSGLPQLLAALLGRGFSSTQAPTIESAAALHLGYNDLSGQLRGARSVSRRSRHAVLADRRLGRRVYSVVVSRRLLAEAPCQKLGGLAVDQFCDGRCRRVARRLVVGPAIARRSSANRSDRRGRFRRADRSHARQHMVQLVQSGKPGAHDLARAALARPARRRDRRATKLARLARHGLGGMGDAARGSGGARGINAGAATADLPLFTRPYPVSCDAALKDAPSQDAASIGPVPVAACSSKCFTGNWSNAKARLVEADLHEGADHRLAGVIRLVAGTSQESPAAGGAGQGSGGGFRLTDCVLIYDRWAYVIPKFSAAEPIDIEQIDPRTADTYFCAARSSPSNIKSRLTIAPAPTAPGFSKR